MPARGPAHAPIETRVGQPPSIMPTTGPALLRRVRGALRDAADPARAEPMRVYMKSAMPFHGVPATELRRVCREVFADVELDSAQRWRDLVLALYRGATHREERYAALALCGDRRARRYRDLEALPMYEELIVTGAWWDLVDGVATHRLGELMAAHPAQTKEVMLAWSRSDDLWKRRAAILCQVRRKKDTDLDLLYRTIEPALASREFFLRKAIGWALRQYAWTDPDEVVRYVRANESRLSPLSKREALKNCAPVPRRKRSG